MTEGRANVPTTAALAVVLAPALSSFAAVGLIPVLPQMVKAFGGNTQLGTLTVTLPLLAAASATALLSFLGDRIPRRTVFIAFAGLYAIAAPLPFWLDTLPLIIAARFLTGLAIGFMVATSLGLIGDLITSERRAVWLSAQSIVAAVLTVGGSALNGFLGKYGWQFAFLINLVGVPVFFMACTLPKAAPSFSNSELGPVAPKSPFPWRATSIIFIMVIVGISLVIPPSFELGYLFSERGIGSSVMIGSMTALISAGAALGAASLPAIRRIAPFLAIALCLMLSSLGQFLVIVAGISFVPLALGVILFGSAQGLLMAFLALWLLNSVEASVRGRATGLFRTLIYLSGFAAPQFARLLSGVLSSSFKTFVFYTLGTLAFALALTAAQFTKGRRPEGATEA